MRAFLSTLLKAGVVLLASPVVAVGVGLIVLVALWKAIFAGLVGTWRKP